MPTLKPRVQVTLEPQTHEVIDRFARLQGRTRGAVIAELLDSVAPSLGRTVALLEAAQAAPGQIKKGLRDVVLGAHQEFLNISGDAAKQLDILLDQLGSEDADGTADPHLVTRGSGITPPGPVGNTKKARKPSKPRGPANG